MRVRHKSGGREVGSRAETVVGDSGDADQDGDRKPCSDGADIVQPLPYGEADEIEKRAERKAEQREQEKVGSIFRERLPVHGADEKRVARSKVQNRRIVRKIARPV